VDATIVPSSGTKQYTFQAPDTFSSGGGLWGINNGVNNGTTLQMGTIIGADSNGDGGIFTYSAASGTKMIPVPPYSDPGGINNLGQVVGVYRDSSYVPHGFLYTPGAKSPVTILDVPGLTAGAWILLSSINDAGWIIGTYNTDGGAGDSHCLLYKPPYTEPILFDSIGSVSCAGWSSALGTITPRS
jgi:probable HAF family extracellular repeat protein